MRAGCLWQRQATWPGQLQQQHSLQLTSLRGLESVPSTRCRGSSGAAASVFAAVMAPQQQALKTYKASEMSAQDLIDATARPRIDFASILGTVRGVSVCTPVTAARRSSQSASMHDQLMVFAGCLSRLSRSILTQLCDFGDCHRHCRWSQSYNASRSMETPR